MFQNISCRLCINICNGHRSLYDEDGSRNEVYALTEKYFSSLLLNMEAVDQFTVICVECWRHIFEFHTFEQFVVLAQKMSRFNKRTSDEVQETQPKTTETNEQQSPNEVAEGIANFAPERVIDCSVHQDSDSDVEFVEYSKTPQNHESVTMTSRSTIPPDHGNVACAEEAEESDEPDEEWEEFDDCVGFFTGGEFDVPANKTTEELPLPEPSEKSPTEPKEHNPVATSNVNSTSDDDICIINAEEDNLDGKLAPQLQGNSSIGLNLNVNSSSDDAICIFNAEEDNLAPQLQGNSSIGLNSNVNSSSDDAICIINAEEDNLVPQLQGNSSILRDMLQSEKPKVINKNLPPPTTQEYDKLIAQWRPDLECALCRESCRNFSLLQLHFAKQHPPARCHIVCCQQQFYSRYELTKHIRFHTDRPAGPFKCAQCSKWFATNDFLKEHQKSVHHARKPKEILPKCPKCSKSSARENLQSDDLLECTCHTYRTCPECGIIFATLKALTLHTNSSHSINKPMVRLQHSCPFCPKTWTHRSNLYRHLRKVHPQEWEMEKLVNAKKRKLETSASFRGKNCRDPSASEDICGPKKDCAERQQNATN